MWLSTGEMMRPRRWLSRSPPQGWSQIWGRTLMTQLDSGSSSRFGKMQPGTWSSRTTDVLLWFEDEFP